MSVVTDSAELRSALRQCRMSFLIGFWFHAFTEVTALAYPIFMVQAFDRVVPARSYATLIALLTGVAIVLLFKAVFTYLRTKLLVLASLRLDRLLSARVFGAFLDRSVAQHDQTGAEALRDLTHFRQFFAGSGAITAMSAPWGALFIGVLFAISPVIGATALALSAIQVAVMIANMRMTKSAIGSASAARNATYRYAEANLRSADAILAMGMAPGLTKAWLRRNDAAISAEAHGSTVGAGFSAFEGSFSVLQSVALLSVAVVEIIRSDLQGGIAFAAVIVFGFAQRPLTQVVHSWGSYLQAREAGARLARLLEASPPPRPAMPLPKPRGEILCRGVVYFPRGAEHPVLRGLGLHVEAGTSLGLVGPIGSGKSTLVRMIVGLIRPTSGEIRLDGAETWAWNRDDLGRHIGYLPQEIGLVSGTVAENIGRFGLFDERDIVAAAERAGAHSTILRLPRGYDTPIGEGGHPLSGGQRQLVGLARAVVGEPSLVVLDEPNSNLDGPGEVALLECIKQLKTIGATLIMVSHRPNLVAGLDRIALLRDGMIQLAVAADDFMERSGRTISIRPKSSEG